MPPPNPDEPQMDTTIYSPPGLRRLSAEWYAGKLADAERAIKELTNRAVGPKEAGVLAVDEVAPVKNTSRARVTSGFGSYEMLDLLGKRKAGGPVGMLAGVGALVQRMMI